MSDFDSYSENEIFILSDVDGEIFIRELANPSLPNDALLCAKEKY
ncbi:hypothetical protein [Mangrovibacterium lignilyticum]|nr:hypothetical protein [Mangrovibacterium lignilyticum]